MGHVTGDLPSKTRRYGTACLLHAYELSEPQQRGGSTLRLQRRRSESFASIAPAVPSSQTRRPAHSWHHQCSFAAKEALQATVAQGRCICCLLVQLIGQGRKDRSVAAWRQTSITLLRGTNDGMLRITVEQVWCDACDGYE